VRTGGGRKCPRIVLNAFDIRCDELSGLTGRVNLLTGRSRPTSRTLKTVARPLTICLTSVKLVKGILGGLRSASGYRDKAGRHN
jgi:hypothetical protein